MARKSNPPPKGEHRITCPCGKSFTAKRPHAKYCTPACRVRGHRAGNEKAPVAAVIELKTKGGKGLTPAEEYVGGETFAELVDRKPLVAMVRATLEQAGRLETWQGQAALELARQTFAVMDTGSMKATLHRELRVAMADALRGAGAGDAINELEARVAAKLTGSAG